MVEAITIAKDIEALEALDPKQYIIIKGARVNNLKNISLAIPRNKMVVVTGLSGSGKTSLAFDTLFAEGQRMYVESLSSYARQFLGRMEKPEVDYIRGVAPAIAIEQKVNTRNPRSTVGTTTEIYDYLKLLYARIGQTFSPTLGRLVTKDTVTDVVNYMQGLEEGTRITIAAPLTTIKDRKVMEELKILLSKGYARMLVNDAVVEIENLINQNTIPERESLKILIDRVATLPNDEDTAFRMADSVQTAYFEGDGTCEILIQGGEKRIFSERFEEDGIRFEEPSIHFFSFNNPYGACRTCEGFGKILGIDEDLVIPDKSLSVYEGAIAPYRGETMRKWLEPLLRHGIEFDFPIHRPYNELDDHHIDQLWKGHRPYKGLDAFFKHLESKTHKIQYRVMLSRYRGRTTCPDCKGTRLRKDASYVKIDGYSISDLVLMPLDDLSLFFDKIKLNDFELKVAGRLLTEIRSRLEYLEKVGLGYLTLNRLTATLSGGEFQRIKLATSLGSALVGSMYILDEPSIGLHPRDTNRLVAVLRGLRDLGNTVIIVEHEEAVMRAADQIIDIGPDAGTHGGAVVFQGTIDDMTNDTNTHTARYLLGTAEVAVPQKRRAWKESIRIIGAREHNLKSIDVAFPLGVMTAITGVSGSGKSTLVREVLYPALSRTLGTSAEPSGKFDQLDGSYKLISQVEMIDQNPIGKSSRSNPVTYVKAYDAIRQLFAELPFSRKKGFKPAFFSFNVDGGRCEECSGEGQIKIEMQFMADIFLTCEHCKGTRFKEDILEARFKDKNISEVLDMTVEESLEFFKDKNAIINKLQPLFDVGLGYVRLGQSSNSLSGGEAQRVKLASFLSKGTKSSKEHVLFIFDEPTTGLHFHDITRLLDAINALVDQGHSAIIIEHNMEVIKSADWVIDLGPDGGEKGGNICFAGTPEDLARLNNNHTAKYLKPKLD